MSDKQLSSCEWCGNMKGFGDNQFCEFCRQFETKERMELEKEWIRLACAMKSQGNEDLIPEQRRQFEKKYGIGEEDAR